MGTEIKLDYDRKTIPAYRIEWITKFFKLNVKDVKVWMSKKGPHIRIKVKEKIPAITVVLLQSLMGSDFKREAYNVLRAFQLKEKKGPIKTNWNVLYYKKKIQGKIASQEVFDKERTERLRGILCLKRL